jgi:glycosyltransferase involved in cell wall biosynthesis
VNGMSSGFINNHRPLRIAMLVPPWYDVPPAGYGGVEQMCAALIGRLIGYGHHVTVIGAGTEHGTPATFVSTSPELRYPLLGEVLPQLLHLLRADAHLARGDFDVVHEHAAIGALAARGRSMPTVLTVHGCPTGDLGDCLTYVDRSVSLVAISEAQRQLRPDLRWSATVHNGLEVVGTGRPAHPDGPVLWLGRLSPDKGPDLAIAACRAAGLPLVLAGKCNEPVEHEYFTGTIEPMLGPDVEMILNPDRLHCDELLATARCLIVPIRWSEPFGMVMVEAMAAGTPVVAMSRGAAPELVEHGVTGLLCTDTAQLPDALHEVVRLDPVACTERVRSTFSADLMARRYVKLYRRLIRQSSVDQKPSGAMAGGGAEERLWLNNDTTARPWQQH